MPRDFYDPDEHQRDMIDREVERAAGEERLRRVEAAKVRNAAADRVEAEERAKRKAAADALSRRANAAELLREYASHGVEPPAVDGNGAPVTSLAMLLRIGWTIERVGDCNVLVKPFS